MKKYGPLILILLLCSVCGKGDPIPAHDLYIHIESPGGEVEFGKAFPVIVTRVWDKSLSPEPWSDKTLAPLVSKQESLTKSENAERIEEIRRFNCYAFQAGELRIDAPDFSAREKNSDEERKVTGDSFVLHVRSALALEGSEPTGSSGEAIELPGKMMPKPFPLKTVILCAGLVVLLAGSFIGYRIRKSDQKEEEPKPAPTPPHVPALARIEKLRSVDPKGHEGVQAFYVEASQVVRDYIEARFAVHAPGMTTEELSNAMDAALFRTLSELMTHCDFVKFGRFTSTREDRSRLLDTATRFIEETRQENPGDGPDSVDSGVSDDPSTIEGRAS